MIAKYKNLLNSWKYFAISGIGAVCHTINPRLSSEQLVYIINHAEDKVIFLDLSFIKLIDDPNHQIIDDQYTLSITQARAILELRLQRLTGMERNKLEKETQDLAEQISEYLIILSDKSKLTNIIQTELDEVLNRLDDPRRTEINDSAVDHDDEDLIQKEDMVVTVSYRGYI